MRSQSLPIGPQRSSIEGTPASCAGRGDRPCCEIRIRMGDLKLGDRGCDVSDRPALPIRPCRLRFALRARLHRAPHCRPSLHCCCVTVVALPLLRSGYVTVALVVSHAGCRDGTAAKCAITHRPLAVRSEDTLSKEIDRQWLAPSSRQMHFC